MNRTDFLFEYALRCTAWRGVVRLDSWECRQMPAAPEAYRDERFFLQWPVAVCDFDPTQVDGAEDYFD